VRLWNPRTGEYLRRLSIQPLLDFCSLSFSTDNAHLLMSNGSQSIMWSVADGLECGRLPCHDAQFDATGTWLVTAGDQGVVLHLNSPRQLRGAHYLLLQKALQCPEQFCADMLGEEQRTQISPECVTKLAAQQKKYLQDVRDGLPGPLKTLVNARMPWLS